MADWTSISLHTWSDPFVRKLSPDQKLLFIWCFTNSHRTLSGMYSVNLDMIKLETGIPVVEDALAALSEKVMWDADEELIFVRSLCKRQYPSGPNVKQLPPIVRSVMGYAPHPFVDEFRRLYPGIRLPDLPTIEPAAKGGKIPFFHSPFLSVDWGSHGKLKKEFPMADLLAVYEEVAAQSRIADKQIKAAYPYLRETLRGKRRDKEKKAPAAGVVN
jgi:hypothetical protein